MLDSDTPRVRKAEDGELDEVVAILGDAFEDDPIMRWVSRKTSYPRFAFALTLPFCVQQGHTYITGARDGAAAWLPPGVALDSPLSPRVVWRGLAEFGPRSLLRGLATLVQTQKHHPKNDYYYLFTIGSLRSARGRGVGSSLMRAGLARCDEEHMPAYLESSNEDNLSFYRKHGFEVVNELRLAMNGPPMWLMWRDAR